MKKGILAIFMVSMLILTFVCSCFSASAVTISNKNVGSQDTDITGTGTIKGTIKILDVDRRYKLEDLYT